ncbi:MAG TPA: hypothetical protein GXX20_09215 [Clostridiaceae bacterium]|nr:hypothetical protein [Clostridiaceae bacterium]
MDWPKAKNILIIVLLILNFVLLLIIGFYKIDAGESKETLNSIKKILENRNVIINCTVPVYNKNIPYIIFENGSPDMAAIAEILLGNVMKIPDEDIAGKVLVSGKKKIVIGYDNTLEYYNEEPSENYGNMDIAQAEEYARDFLKNLNIQVDNYELDNYSISPEGDYTLLLIEKYKDFYIFDNYAIVNLSGSGIKKLIFGYKKIKGFSPDSEVSAMSAYQVLVKNADKINNVTITDIDIGFKGFFQPGQEVQKSSEGPSWRVITEEGDCFYFKASDGEPVM